MSRKLMSLGISSNQNKEKKQRLQAEKLEKAQTERRTSRRAFVVLGVMVMLVFSIGALAGWRSLNSETASNSVGLNLSAALVTSTPPTLPSNEPAKEFIYAGSALLATTEAFREPPDDIAVWRPGTSGGASTWYILNVQQQITSQQFGFQADSPLTRDFDGDGKTDFCIYRQSAGQWHIIRSSDLTYYVVTFGAANDDIPAPADYDGDGKADIAVFRTSTKYWYIKQSSNDVLSSVYFGATGDKPESADFDGDGKSDLAVWRNSTASFYVKKSTDNSDTGYSIGANDDEPVIGDYDGDGKADYAVRTSGGVWKIRQSSDGSPVTETWGYGSDIAVQGNYSDGDAKTDIAVWRPSTGVWYIRKSTDGSLRTPVQFGQNGDKPVPAPYRR